MILIQYIILIITLFIWTPWIPIYNHVMPHDSNSNMDSSGGFVGGSSGGDFGGGGGGGSDAF